LIKPPAEPAEEITPISFGHANRTRPQVPTMVVGFASHVGMVRKRNQDAGLVITSTTLGDSPLPPFGLYVVADGMGGHSHGEMASQLAARIVARQVVAHIYPPHLALGDGELTDPVQDILREALQRANWQVHNAVSDSGTTLTCALVLGSRLYIAHVGDSRAYMLRPDEPILELLTHDHSFVQRLQDSGNITPEEAAAHPQRNVLDRAVGQGQQLDVDTFSRSLPTSCWILLCSDGLWGVVPTETLQGTVLTADSPQAGCQRLIDAALRAGAPDNVTAILVHLQVPAP
jgi:serine/threonine protein phosphatase PrpC